MLRKFAVFDIDGTLFRSHLYLEVVLELARNNKLHKDINSQALELYEAWKRRAHAKAFEEFDEQIITAIDSLLTELNPNDYDTVVEKVIVPKLDYVYLYTKNILNKLQSEGYFTIALSGSRIEEVSLFAPYHGFDDWIGQQYERTEDGSRYTGEVKKTFKDKHIILEGFVKKHNLTYDGSYAIGDSAGDITLLEAVENPIAFNPNDTLLEYAKTKNWKIVVERKSIAYTLEPDNGTYVLA